MHEAYLKLIAGEHQTYQDRIHFFAVASRAMRQILVDYAHRSPAADPGRAEELIAVSEALSELELLDETLARVVELRFFGGLSVEEAGDALGLSPRTIERDWRKARAFLYQALRGAGTPLER